MRAHRGLPLLSRDCATGTCDATADPANPVYVSCSDGAKNGLETDVDCGGPDCDRYGSVKACLAAADCAFAGPRINGVKGGDKTDVDCGGSCIREDGSGKCLPPAMCGGDKACLGAADCAFADPVCGGCVANACASASDGLKNGVEMDVDCVGTEPCIARCQIDKVYAVDGDCDTGKCDATVLKCRAFTPAETCSDGAPVKDRLETDVDYGGADCQSVGATCAGGSARGANTDCASGQCTFCESCGSNKACLVPSDCASGKCFGSPCAKDDDCCTGNCDASTKKYRLLTPDDTSTNVALDGSETDLDCSGYDCRASGYTCADALLCGVDADCLSGQCTNVGQQTRCTSCNNGVKDGLESGVDCGGEECGGCGDGLPCGAT